MINSLVAVNPVFAVLQALLLIIGFVLLVFGADLFVDGASGIAEKLKVSTFIIGLTVVALGTSAPEMAVTVVSAIQGEGGIIVGNITGSNIINILLILGISATICNLPVEKNSRFIDLPFLILVSGLFLLFGITGTPDRFEWWEGLILIALYAGFMAYTILLAVKQSKSRMEEVTATSAVFEGDNVRPADTEGIKGAIALVKSKYESLKKNTVFLVVITLVGLVMVVGGAQLVVDSAKYLAEEVLNIPTEIVALTVVAFGTSLPELVTSVSAAKKGDVGIATGNIIGSNIANILLIGGLGAVCSGGMGLAFSAEGLVSGLVALAAAVIIFAFSFGKTKSLGRVAGITLLLCLASYYAVVFMNYYGVINIY